MFFWLQSRGGRLPRLLSFWPHPLFPKYDSDSSTIFRRYRFSASYDVYVGFDTQASVRLSADEGERAWSRIDWGSGGESRSAT